MTMIGGRSSPVGRLILGRMDVSWCVNSLSVFIYFMVQANILPILYNAL